MKVASGDRRCIEIDGVTGLRYRAKDGMFDMHPRDAKATVADGGFYPSLSGSFPTGIGYRCTGCDFRTFFTTCSRCGGKAVREVANAT